jgi:hypothetical protein
MTRRSATLRTNGIERVSTTFDAISDGCTIASLSDSGPVQAKGRPCVFYDTFGDIADVASDEPGTCVDGSGDHARTGALAVFTGDRMVVWGGGRGGHFTYGDVAMDGLVSNPKTGRWARVPPPDVPTSARQSARGPGPSSSSSARRRAPTTASSVPRTTRCAAGGGRSSSRTDGGAGSRACGREAS